MKKVCLIYANCQNRLIAQYLNRSADFGREYLIHCFPIHNLIEQQTTIPEELLKQADLFIYQPVKDHHGDRSSKFILSKLAPDCQTISFPPLYFKGYFPQFCKNPHNHAIKPNYPYGIIPHGDTNIISLLAAGKSEHQIIETLSDPDFYSREFLLNNLDNTLKELATRESQLSIKVSDFIRNHYQDYYLFHTQNHPADILGVHVVNQILKLLKLPPLTEKLLVHNITRGVLDNFQIPIYPSVIKHLELNCVDSPFVYRHSSFSTNEMTFARYISEYIALCSPTKDNVTSLYFKSIDLARKKKFALSAETLQQAINIKPKRATYYGDLGKILYQQNKLHEAALAYKKAIALSPKWEEFYQSLGIIFSANNNFAGAISIYERAIAINPDNSQFYRLLGDIFMKQDKLDQAKDNYLKAIELDPVNAFNYRCLGDVFRKQQKWHEATNNYQKAINLSPRTEYLYKNLADILAKQNKLDKAINTCQQGIKILQRNSDLHRNLGNFQLKKGNIDDALVAYQKAIKLEPRQMKNIFNKLNTVLKTSAEAQSSILSNS